jgi:hypothetical protein
MLLIRSHSSGTTRTLMCFLFAPGWSRSTNLGWEEIARGLEDGILERSKGGNFDLEFSMNMNETVGVLVGKGLGLSRRCTDMCAFRKRAWKGTMRTLGSRDISSSLQLEREQHFVVGGGGRGRAGVRKAETGGSQCRGEAAVLRFVSVMRMRSNDPLARGRVKVGSRLGVAVDVTVVCAVVVRLVVIAVPLARVPLVVVIVVEPVLLAPEDELVLGQVPGVNDGRQAQLVDHAGVPVRGVPLLPPDPLGDAPEHDHVAVVGHRLVLVELLLARRSLHFAATAGVDRDALGPHVLRAVVLLLFVPTSSRGRLRLRIVRMLALKEPVGAVVVVRSGERQRRLRRLVLTFR